MDRAEFIKGVRSALGRVPGSPDPPYAPLEETQGRLRQRVETLRSRMVERWPEAQDQMARVAQARGWKVHRPSDSEEALDYVVGVATAQSNGLAARSDQEVFREIPVDSALSSAGLRVEILARSAGLSLEDQRRSAATAGVGITGADYAIAETGSVVLLPGPGVSRLVSLAPPVHVALVRPQELLETLEDLFLLRRNAYYDGDGDMGSYMNFITGPSRTADIEQTIVVGVHGPREVHLVLLPPSL